jgi:hypothetical protein
MRSERASDHSMLAAGPTLWLRTAVLSASLVAVGPAAAQTSSSGAPAQSTSACASALDEAELTAAMKEAEFKRFVEAQLTWDRAMAEALAEARQNFGNAVVVGILGSGHVAGGRGSASAQGSRNL